MLSVLLATSPSLGVVVTHQQDFHPEKRNLTLKELGECMQCSSKCESELCTGKKMTLRQFKVR